MLVMWYRGVVNVSYMVYGRSACELYGIEA
jgi:hypothetical protein